jgi:hypothetical protein
MMLKFYGGPYDGLEIVGTPYPKMFLPANLDTVAVEVESDGGVVWEWPTPAHVYVRILVEGTKRSFAVYQYDGREE